MALALGEVKTFLEGLSEAGVGKRAAALGFGGAAGLADEVKALRGLLQEVMDVVLNFELELTPNEEKILARAYGLLNENSRDGAG